MLRFRTRFSRRITVILAVIAILIALDARPARATSFGVLLGQTTETGEVSNVNWAWISLASTVYLVILITFVHFDQNQFRHIIFQDEQGRQYQRVRSRYSDWVAALSSNESVNDTMILADIVTNREVVLFHAGNRITIAGPSPTAIYGGPSVTSTGNVVYTEQNAGVHKLQHYDAGTSTTTTLVQTPGLFTALAGGDINENGEVAFSAARAVGGWGVYLRQGINNIPIVEEVGSSRVDLQACKLEYSIVSPK